MNWGDTTVAPKNWWERVTSVRNRAFSSRKPGLVLSWSLGIILAGGIILWLGGRGVVEAVQHVEGPYLGLALFALLLGSGLRLVKWQLVLRKEYDFSETTIAFLASKLWGGLLPARVGEFAPLTISRYRTARVSALVIIDRVFESYATLLAGAIGFIILGFRDQTMIVLWISIVVIVSIGFFVATSSALWHRFQQTFGKWRLLATIFQGLEKVSSSLQTLRRYWLLLLSLSLIATMLDFVFIQFLFFSLSQKVSLLLIAVAWCASAFAAMVSITPAGLGIADASYLYVYHLEGIPSATLGAFFVLNRVITLSMPVLLLFFVTGLVQHRRRHS